MSPRGSARRARRRPRALAGRLAVVLVLAIGTGLWGLGWIDHWRGHDRLADTPAPRALTVALPDATPADPVAAPADGTLQAAPVRQVLARGIARALGSHVLAAVAGTSGGLVAQSGHGAAVPASTNKLLTAAAVLALEGPEKRYATRTVLSGGTVTLVGGGDPLLASRPSTGYPQAGDVTTLAKQTAAALRSTGRRVVRLRYDASLFTGPVTNPTWPASYLGEGIVAPITALWVDEGRTTSDPEGTGRVADPAASAAVTFEKALVAAGVRVMGPVRSAVAPDGAAELARVESPPLREIVGHVLQVSDNEGAEVLAHQAGLAAGDGASFDGGVKAVLGALHDLDVDTTGLVLHDGSGLSRANRVTATALVQVLQRATTEPRLAPIVGALPVAGFSGSLLERFDALDGGSEPGRGLVRAKTGTLTGVDALAGYTQDATGSPVVFAVLADHVAVPNTLAARAALDDLAAGLTTCRCG